MVLISNNVSLQKSADKVGWQNNTNTDPVICIRFVCFCFPSFTLWPLVDQKVQNHGQHRDSPSDTKHLRVEELSISLWRWQNRRREQKAVLVQ